MKIKITTDNSADLPYELYEKFNISTVAIPVILGDEEFASITAEEIYSFVEKTGTLPKTSATNEFTYETFFDDILKEYDGIVHISISSGISSTFSNAEKAANNKSNVFVVDGKTLCVGTGLLALIAAYFNDGKNTAEEIYKQVLHFVPKVYISFILEQLNYMRMGGRCNAITLLGANWLKIKPSLTLKDSKIVPHKRYKGKQEDVMMKYLEFTLEENQNINKEIIFLPQTKDVPQKTREDIIAKLKALGFKHIIEILAGGVITSHCGEGTFGFCFLNN